MHDRCRNYDYSTEISLDSEAFCLAAKQLKTVPDYYLGRNGGLSFLERRNYDTEYIDSLPSLYKDILKFFN